MEPGQPSPDRRGAHALRWRAAVRFPALAGAAVLAAVSWRCGDGSGPGAVADQVEVAAATITAADMSLWIGALAHDSMRGRQTPSPETDELAQTVGDAFQASGLSPLFAGQFLQSYMVPKSLGVYAPNVGAVRRGRDPSLRDEYVLFIAHMDHLGVGATVAGDSIYNGADDNASGSAAVIEIGQAVGAMQPGPRRSVIVLLVSGEEHGFWGSKAFVGSPPVALDRIVAVLNLDMVSRNHPDSMPVAGIAATTLGDAVVAAATAHPEDHLGVREGQNGLSDHIPFNGVGIPWLLFFAGVHPDYHQPSDEPPRSDPDKAARVARLAFRTGMIVAEADARPGPRTPP